jgi:hypothetical protein
MRWVGHVAYMGVKVDTVIVWVDKPEARRPFVRSRYRCEGNINRILNKEDGNI